MKNGDLGISKKNTFLFISFVFTISTTGFAAPRQIGDWEQTLNGWSPGTFLYSYNPITGVTSGNYSLRVNDPSMYLELNNVPGGGGRQSFLENEIFSIDVTTLASEWPGTLYTNMSIAINAGDGGSNHMWNSLTPIYWPPANGNYTQTLSWDYSAQRDIMAGWTMGAGSYLAIEVNADWLTSGNGGVFYFDNVWLTIPEPTTIALLSFGALALLRRKR